MNKQTAIEWLINEMSKTRDYQRVINEVNQSSTSVRDLIAEAKEMEKEQMSESWYNGHYYDYNTEEIPNDIFEQYYNETYGE